MNQLRGKQDNEHVVSWLGAEDVTFLWSVVLQHSCGFVFSLTC